MMNVKWLRRNVCFQVQYLSTNICQHFFFSESDALKKKKKENPNWKSLSTICLGNHMKHVFFYCCLNTRFPALCLSLWKILIAIRILFCLILVSFHSSSRAEKLINESLLFILSVKYRYTFLFIAPTENSGKHPSNFEWHQQYRFVNKLKIVDEQWVDYFLSDQYVITEPQFISS